MQYWRNNIGSRSAWRDNSVVGIHGRRLAGRGTTANSWQRALYSSQSIAERRWIDGAIYRYSLSYFRDFSVIGASYATLSRKLCGIDIVELKTVGHTSNVRLYDYFVRMLCCKWVTVSRFCRHHRPRIPALLFDSDTITLCGGESYWCYSINRPDQSSSEELK